MSRSLNPGTYPPTELHIAGPTKIPSADKVRAVVESCLARSNGEALADHQEYVARRWRSVASFVPEGLDTEAGFRQTLDKVSSHIMDSLSINRNRLTLAWADLPELVIGSYALTTHTEPRQIWRGVGLWATPGVLADAE